MAESPQSPNTNEVNEKKSRWSMTRVAGTTAVVLVAIILLVFGIGLVLALSTGVEQTALTVEVIRDLFIIILILQGILIVGALTILILQVARLINLLQNEIMPILQNTRETVTTAKGTVEFVGSNLAEPVMRLNGFLAALVVLIRELFGIRRAIRHETVVTQDEDEA